ncbi:MAG: carboxymuconolactone decarboxylase family protein [Bacteroidia bacterium]
MSETITHETVLSLAASLNADPEKLGEGVKLLAATDHKYLRDFKINVTNALKFATLSQKESYLLALAAAVNDQQPYFKEVFGSLAKEAGATEGEIAETYACVSLLSVNNVYYRFKHFVKKEVYQNMPAGIRMSIMMTPAMGKEFFELMSLAVSALNGCEMCVASHEESLMKMGTEPQRVFDAVRVVAMMRGMYQLS